ncbi:MAG: adenosylcobinamide-GDP ribazoletransferase [Nitrospirae bacterium]|nr:adenosylcobinamide-GDP ribazoletransferase [Nitrospirota bacterium]
MSYKNKYNNSLEDLSLTRRSSLLTRFLLAFQFLTIIPLKRMDNVSENEIGSSSAFFPLVGAFQGALLVLAAASAIKVFPVELANGLVVLILVITAGGLHLDGLADTFDAIASRGSKEKKLAIMKDSTVGPFGVMAIVLVILLKYLSFNALFINSSRVIYYSSLFLMPVFSRWIMVSAIFHTKSARQEGLGKIFIEHTGIKEMVSATFFTVLFSFIALFVTDNHVSHYALLITYYSLILAVLYIFCIIAVWFANKNFGGMTGDTFGAVSEISEILFLIMAVICSQRFI